jgi:hypothetical protein
MGIGEFSGDRDVEITWPSSDAKFSKEEFKHMSNEN